MRYFDNDMDDLFNKAGKDYPLNTGKKDWNAVQKKLASQEDTPPAANSKNYKRYYPLLLLLLMLPAVFFFFNNNVSNQQIANTNKPDNASGASTNSTDNVNTSTINTDKINDPDKTGNTDNSNNNITNDNISKSNNDNNNNKSGANNITNNNPNATGNSTNTIRNNKTINQSSSNSVINDNKNRTDHSDNIGRNNTTNNPNSTDKNTPSDIRQKITNKNIAAAVNRGNPTKDVNVISTEKNLEKSLFPFVLYDENFQPPYSTFTTPPVKDASPAPSNSSTAEKKSRTPGRSFYYGVMAGPDLSSIKYQEIKNVGSGVGLLLGYRFSPHWSVEVSAYWSKKNYYTDGKYFDKTAAGIPAYAEVYYLDGGCNMIELPIDVRYEFTPGKNTFFLTAGFNSYFMKKESYEYKADAMGWVYEGYKDYRNSGNKIFSNLQISGGYQHKLFSNIILRIEPYFQVPLRQVGIGNIPITSTGIRFGLLHDTR